MIVFDDVHRVDDPGFFAFLDGLIERLGPHWCIAITSRTEPPLALARLRAADELAEFRQLHLQFARDEARRARAGRQALDETVADRLFDRTHGWPAGLRIAVGARTEPWRDGRPGAVELLHASDRPMFEFLVSEVTQQLPVGLRRFSARGERIAGARRRALRGGDGRSEAAAHLDEIERLGLFVDVLEAPVRTLRLHDLFRDALQERLRLERPDEWRMRLQRAATGETDPLRRQALWLAAGCETQAAEALLAAAPSLNLRRRGAHDAAAGATAFTPAFAAASPELQRTLGLVKQDPVAAARR